MEYALHLQPAHLNQRHCNSHVWVCAKKIMKLVRVGKPLSKGRLIGDTNQDTKAEGLIERLSGKADSQSWLFILDVFSYIVNLSLFLLVDFPF